MQDNWLEKLILLNRWCLLMKATYFKANFNIARKSKKNILLMGLLVVFMIFFVLVVEAQNIGNTYRQWRSYYESIEVNVGYFDSSSLRKRQYKETYDNLNQQQGYISGLQNGEVMDDPQSYLEGSIELLQAMLKGYSNNYVGASTLNVMPKYQIHQRLVTYKYLHKHHIPVAMNSKTSSTYLIYILNLVAVFIFLYILLISSDIWIVKFDHKTVLEDIPYRVEDEVKGKTAINMVLVMIPLLISLVGAYIFAGVRNGFYSLNYPNVFYFNKIRAIPLWLNCLLFLLYTAILVIFVTSLTLLLNQITKNVYLSIFIGIAIYVLSYLPGKLLKLIFWLPSPYLNVNAIFSGTVASITGFKWLNFVTGALILLIWSAILMLCFRYLVNKGRNAR